MSSKEDLEKALAIFKAQEETTNLYLHLLTRELFLARRLQGSQIFLETLYHAQTEICPEGTPQYQKRVMLDLWRKKVNLAEQAIEAAERMLHQLEADQSP